MRIACWLPKATNAHSEYVIPTAVPRQRWLLDRASLLRSSTLPILLVPAYGLIHYLSYDFPTDSFRQHAI